MLYVWLIGVKRSTNICSQSNKTKRVA